MLWVPTETLDREKYTLVYEVYCEKGGPRKPLFHFWADFFGDRHGTCKYFYGMFPSRFIVNFKKWKNISEKQKKRENMRNRHIYVCVYIYTHIHILTIHIRTEA